MIISDADDCCYLGFLDILEMNTVNLCLQSGDWLSLNFNSVFNNAADDWSAFVVNSLSFASHSNVILIFIWFWDKTEKNWKHLDIILHSVDLSKLTFSDTALNILLHVKSISVRIKIQNSDKLYREQMSALNSIQREICNLYVKQILLDNQYDNLPEIDLYDSVQEDVKTLLSKLNFNENF